MTTPQNSTMWISRAEFRYDGTPIWVRVYMTRDVLNRIAEDFRPRTVATGAPGADSGLVAMDVEPEVLVGLYQYWHLATTNLPAPLQAINNCVRGLAVQYWSHVSNAPGVDLRAGDTIGEATPVFPIVLDAEEAALLLWIDSGHHLRVDTASGQVTIDILNEDGGRAVDFALLLSLEQANGLIARLATQIREARNWQGEIVAQLADTIRAAVGPDTLTLAAALAAAQRLLDRGIVDPDAVEAADAQDQYEATVQPDYRPTRSARPI